MLGYLLFRAFGASHNVEAAPVEENSIDTSAAFTCSAEQIHHILNDDDNGQGDTSDLANLLMDHCSLEFIDANPLSKNVKSAVDDWLDTDVSNATPKQLTQLNLLAMMMPKPAKMDEQVESECKEMNQKYEKFREDTAELSDKLKVEMKEELTEDEREFLDYSLYSMFCKIMTQKQ